MKVTLAISCYSAFTSIPNSSDIAYFSEASSSFLLCSVQFQLEPVGEIGCSQRVVPLGHSVNLHVALLPSMSLSSILWVH